MAIDRVVRVHGLLVLALVPWACARIPATGETPVKDEPAPSEVAPPERERGPSTVGTQKEREAGLARLEGIWVVEGEVWDIVGDEARVYRPREQDVVVEREIEMIAPCMFMASEPGQHAAIGPFVVHREFRTRPPDPSVRVTCRAPEVHRVVAEHCEAWRFDREQRAFEPIDCDPRPSTEVADEEGPIRVHNLASACHDIGDPGCTRAQAQQLIDDHWAEDDGTCSGAALRVRLDELWPNEAVKVPRDCVVYPPSGAPLFELGEGIALVEQPARVRPGDSVELEFMFENTAAQAQTLRLPAAPWMILVSRGGKPIPMSGCRGSGSGLMGRGGGVEFRLEPGGTLTLAVPWTAAGQVGEGEACRFKPLRRGEALVRIEMIEGDPNAVLEQTVQLEGKPSCDPCPEPLSY